MKLPLLAGVTLLLGLVSPLGCGARSRQLVDAKIVGTRLIQYTWEPSSQSSDEAGRLYSLRLWVCDLQADGTETRCHTNVILRNVAPLRGN